MVIQEVPCAHTPYRGMGDSVMKKIAVMSNISLMKLQSQKSYEPPAYASPEVIELGSIETLTWTGSAVSFTIST